MPSTLFALNEGLDVHRMAALEKVQSEIKGKDKARVNAEEKTGAAAMEGIEELAAGSGMNEQP